VSEIIRISLDDAVAAGAPERAIRKFFGPAK